TVNAAKTASDKTRNQKYKAPGTGMQRTAREAADSPKVSAHSLCAKRSSKEEDDHCHTVPEGIPCATDRVFSRLLRRDLALVPRTNKPTPAVFSAPIRHDNVLRGDHVLRISAKGQG